VEEGATIGAKTRVWAFAHVLGRAKIGLDCNICDHVFIENDVEIGDRVTIKSGVQVWDGLRIHDDVFVGPNATFTNDRFPRSKRYPAEFLRTVIHAGASIGANATLLPGIQIGRGAMVGAGSVVTRNVPPNAIVAGNPASIIGYVSTEPRDGDGGAQSMPVPPQVGIADLGVGGCKMHRLPFIQDMRGALSVVEFEKNLPFVPQRCFWVFDVPSREVRGEHAHKQLHQFLICMHGSLSVVVDDGAQRREVTLDRPDLGLHIPPGVWGTQYRYSPDAVLVVFASAPYSAGDYVRSYDEFVASYGKPAGTE
jgi:UDP-2-acetamido-3-amino-2,3-dideoxy-glucuronate N-acetyltransferase